MGTVGDVLGIELATPAGSTVSAGDDHLVGSFMVSGAAGDQLLDSDDGGEHESQLGHDQSLAGQEGQSTVGQWDEASGQDDGDHHPSVLLVSLATTLGEVQLEMKERNRTKTVNLKIIGIQRMRDSPGRSTC